VRERRLSARCPTWTLLRSQSPRGLPRKEKGGEICSCVFHAMYYPIVIATVERDLHPRVLFMLNSHVINSQRIERR